MGITTQTDHGLSFVGNQMYVQHNHPNNPVTLLTLNSAGDMGIGTVSPGAKLDISTNDTNGLRLINPDSAEVNQSYDPPSILFQANGWDTHVGSRAYSARIRVNSNYSGAPDRGNTHPVMNFDLETNENDPDDTLSTKMVINAAGNVGIGTTSPGHKLEVKASGGEYGCHIIDDTGSSLGGLFVSEQGTTTDGLELYLKKPAGSTRVRLSTVAPSYINAGQRFSFNVDPTDGTALVSDFYIAGGSGFSQDTTKNTLGVKRVGPVVGPTDNVTNYHKASVISINENSIDLGGEDHGYRVAVDGSAYINSTSFKGYLKQAIGVWARAGTYARPVYPEQNPTGTIDQAISLYVDCLWGSGTTINESYGVFQRSAYYPDPDSSKNYFQSRVGIGVTDPEAKLHVQIPGYGDLAYFQDGATGRGLKISQDANGTWIKHGGGDNLYFQNNAGLKALEIRNDGGTRIYNSGTHTYYSFENQNEINAKKYNDGTSTEMFLNWAGGDIKLGKNITAQADGDLHSVKMYIGGVNDTRYGDNSGDGGITLAGHGSITATNGPVLQISKSSSSGWANSYFNVIDPGSGMIAGNRYMDFLSDGSGAFAFYGDDSKNFYIKPNDSNTTGKLHLNGTVYVDDGDFIIRDVGPELVLQDSNSTTTTNQIGYLSFRDGLGVDNAWVGFGANDENFFRVRSKANTPILIQTRNQICVGEDEHFISIYKSAPPPGGLIGNDVPVKAKMVVNSIGAGNDIGGGDDDYVADFYGAQNPRVSFTSNASGSKRVGFIEAVDNMGMRIANDLRLSSSSTVPKIDITNQGVIIEAANTMEPYGTLQVNEKTNHGGIVVDVPANKQAHLRMYNNGTPKWQIRCPFQDATSPDTMRVYSWTAGGDVLTINNNGNVGIGKNFTNPGNTLTVKSTQNQPLAVVTENPNTWIDITNDTGSWSVGNNSDNEFAVYSRFGTSVEGKFLAITRDGRAEFGDAMPMSSTWGGGRIYHPNGIEGGWGEAHSTTRYPHIGSWGTSSLIMLENPHIPWRTDNGATGTYGRSGIRCALPTRKNYIDVGVMEYSEGTFFHVYNNGLVDNRSLIKTDLVGNTEIAGVLEARQHSDWTQFGQIDRVRYQGDVITVENADTSGYTALVYGNTGVEVNAFSRAARVYTDFTASVEFRTTDETHLGIMFGAQEDGGSPQDNNYSVIVRPYQAVSATQAAVRVQKRHSGNQVYLNSELSTGYLMNDGLWHTLHVSVTQPNVFGQDGWIVVHLDDYKYFEGPLTDTAFTSGTVGVTTYNSGAKTSFRSFKVDRKRVLNSVGPTQIAGYGATDARFEMVRLDSGTDNDPVFKFRSKGGTQSNQALGGFWWSNTDANDYNVAMTRVRTNSSDGKHGRFEWVVSDNTSSVSNSKTPNMSLQREWLRVYGDSTDVYGNSMKYPQMQVIGERTDGYGSGIDIVSGDLNTGACSPFIRFYDTAQNAPFATTTGDLSWAIGADDAGTSTFRIVSAKGGNRVSSIASGHVALAIKDISLEVGIPGELGVGTLDPVAKIHIYKSEPSNYTGRAAMARFELENNCNVNFDLFGDGHSTRPSWFQMGAWNTDVGIAIVSDTIDNVQNGSSTKGIFIKNGNVGVGTDTPTSAFEVVGDAGQLFSVVDDMSGIIFSVNDSSGIPSFEVEDNGNVHLTEFGGKVMVGSPIYTSSLMNVGGTINATAFTTSSDQTLKTNIQPIADAVSKVKQIGGYTFDTSTSSRESTGVIAQEIEKVLPQVVFGEEGSKSVNYGNIVGLLIEAIKEQQQTIETQNSRIDALEQQLK